MGRTCTGALLALLALVAAACGGSDGGGPAQELRRAGEGDTVAVHYRGTLDSGEEFDSSRGRDPLSFAVGANQVIAGFDQAVRGLAVGESVTVRMEAAQAYGELRDDLRLELPIDQAPAGVAVGSRMRLANGAQATVISIGDGIVVLDANHPLAGQALTFEIELVSIEPAE